MMVGVDALNERDRPNGNIVGVLHRGALVTVFENRDGWARITQDGYPPRWVFASMLCEVAKCASKPSH